MPVNEEKLENTLTESFPDSEIILKDLVGDEDHWEVKIKSSKFEGLNRLEQHRLVQDAVKHLNIHALSIKTGTN